MTKSKCKLTHCGGNKVMLVCFDSTCHKMHDETIDYSVESVINYADNYLKNK